jgi:Flp pilus assembly pilin Flp
MTRFLLTFLRSEDGTASVEFVIIFPIVMTMFLSAIELGVLMTRQGMLDRGLDLTVRQVRLGAFDRVPPARLHDALRTMICNATTMIPDCLRQVKLEMVPMDPRGGGFISGDVDCVDRAAPNRPARSLISGQSNELMILRACVLFNPILPTSGLAAQLVRPGDNTYALVSTAAFVIEPD